MKSLKELRKHNNLKQREVVQHIGVSDGVYSYYEKGRTLPAKYVKPLANLFGISCDELLENNTDTLDWEREFGCIERTERLELPTWEELFKEDRVLDCYTQEFGIVKNRSFIGVVLLGVDFTNEIVEVSIGSDQIFCELLTKENYTIACKRARDLFLGDNNEI